MKTCVDGEPHKRFRGTALSLLGPGSQRSHPSRLRRWLRRAARGRAQRDRHDDGADTDRPIACYVLP